MAPRTPGGCREKWSSGELRPPPSTLGCCWHPKGSQHPNMHPPGRYLQNYIRNLFAGAWEPRDVSPLPVQVPLATEDEVGFGGDWDGFGGWFGVRQSWGLE